VVGLEAATVLASLLDNIVKARGGAFLTAVGAGLMVYFASEFVVQFRAAFHSVWETTPRRGFRGAIIRRLLSFAAVLGAVMGGLLVLVVSLLGSIAGPIIARSAPEGVWIWRLLANGLSFGLVTAMLALVFRYGPLPRAPWPAAWRGAVFTAVLFTVGNFCIGLFIARSLLASLYGAAGVLIVLLIWIFAIVQILLLGAEFTRADAQQFTRDAAALPGPAG
jgi:membrane protein